MSPADLLWAGIGFALGSLHFLGLRANAALFVRSALVRAAALQLLRLAATGAGLVLAARHGALPLLLAALGLLLARRVVIRGTGATA